MIAIALLTINGIAQDKKDRKDFLKELSAEEVATLKTKRMTLHLDLTESQQEQVKVLITEDTKHKDSQRKKFEESKKNEKPSKEERYAKENERLDRQIEMKKQMKTILNDEQYEKWNSLNSKKKQKKHQKRKSNKNH